MALAFRRSGVDKIFINLNFESGFSLENIVSIGNGQKCFFLTNCTPDAAGLVFIDNYFSVEQILFEFGRGDGLNVNIHNKETGEILYSETLAFHHSFFIPFFDFARSERFPPFLAKDYKKPEFLAVFTHVYNEADMLKVWENHYAQMVQYRHLYVIDHGSTTSPKTLLHDETNVVVIPRGSVDHANISGFCNYFQRFLLTQYAWVVHVDCDELLIHENGVQAFLAKLAAMAPGVIIKPKHAYDVVHDYRTEPSLVDSVPASLQRSTLKMCPHYRKPVVASIQTSWGLGFHDAFEQYAMVEDETLWMIHMAFADLERNLAKDEKWKKLPLSEADEAFIGQTQRVDTIADIKHKFDRLLEKDGMEMPQWMRGMF